MDNSSKYDFPWELIAESLTGNLTVEGELQLQQWFSSDPENKRNYLQIQEMWQNGMEDYKFYRLANEMEAWKNLQNKLSKDHPEQLKTKIIRGQFIQRRVLLRNLVSIAAVFVVVSGIGLWYLMTKNNPVIYETAINIQKKVTLIDGSVITLNQQSKIEVAHSYNKSDRKIIMTFGEARFDVVHNPDKPFTVELGTILIKDIGTIFTVHKEEKKINIAVSSGKVAFVKIATRETRELNAGSGITYDIQNNSFGEIETVNSSALDEQLLTFENASLSEVVVAIQQVYGAKVIINDSIAGKKFTGQLYGMPYHSVIKVISKSLGLDYVINDSIYTLKAKSIEQP